VSAWTDDRVASLKRLWIDGLSASQIALRLGGCTRNAVIGKVHRLDLPKRANTSRARAAYRRPRALRPQKSLSRKPRQLRLPKRDRGFDFAPLPDALVKATVLGVAPEDATINRRPLAELEATNCRWPIGDPRHDHFGFCGASVLQGRPYCDRHCGRAFRSA
jgi:GcrA cell cycle regulator